MQSMIVDSLTLSCILFHFCPPWRLLFLQPWTSSRWFDLDIDPLRSRLYHSPPKAPLSFPPSDKGSVPHEAEKLPNRLLDIQNNVKKIKVVDTLLNLRVYSDIKKRAVSMNCFAYGKTNTHQTLNYDSFILRSHIAHVKCTKCVFMSATSLVGGWGAC